MVSFLLLLYVWRLQSLAAPASPVRDCTVALEVTLHILSSPGDLGSVPHY